MLSETREGLVTLTVLIAKCPVPLHPGQCHHAGCHPLPALEGNSGTSHVSKFVDTEKRLGVKKVVLKDLTVMTRSALDSPDEPFGIMP